MTSTSTNAGKGFLWMLLLMTALLGIRHFDLLKAPNSYFIGNSLDGFRSMAANFYHIRHDSTYQHFEGMHYPYGDHPGYADTFPLLSNAVKYFFKNDTTYFLGIWNLILVFSQLLCGLFLYLVFRALKLPAWFSIAAALGISTLTPQLDRFAAHYALSFAFLVPLTILLLIRFGEKPRIYLSVLIGLIPLLANEIHPYHMAMVVFLVAGYFGFRFLHHPSWKNLGWLLSHAFIQLILPLGWLLYQTVLNDPISDRPQLPWGYTFYYTRPQSLLLPVDLPLGRVIDENIEDIDYVLAETRSYLGAVVILGGLFLLIRALVMRIRAKKHRTIPSATMRYLLWSALVILLYAACFPFVILDWEWMTDYLGLLRQFRVLGRFAWVFFYVSNIAVLYALFHLIDRISNGAWRKVAFGLVLGVLLLEGVGYIFWEKYELIPRPENREHFSREDNPWLYTLDPDRYQAILPVPYYHIGCENFWLGPIGDHLHRVQWAGVETGLPVMGSFMGRTSIGQTVNLIQAVSEPYRVLVLLEDLPDQRPLLLFITKGAYKHLGYKYAHLKRGATQVYEDETIRLFELPVAALAEQVELQHRRFLQEVDTVKMYAHGDVFSKDSLRNFVYESYDEEKATTYYQGGGKAFASREPHVIFEDSLPGQQNKDPYVFSVWAKMDTDLSPRIRLLITEYEPESGKVIQKLDRPFHQDVRSVDQGWMLVDIPFRVKREDSTVRLTVSNNGLLYGQDFYLDEFQIRHQAARVYRLEKDWVVVNNRWIPRGE